MILFSIQKRRFKYKLQLNPIFRIVAYMQQKFECLYLYLKELKLKKEMEKTRSPLLYINVYTVKMHRMKKIYMKKEMEKTRTKIKDK